jgi:hypothetical protein
LQNKIKTPILVKFSLMVLLLVTSGVTLTACQNVHFGPDSAKKAKEEKAAKVNKKKATGNQATKSKPTSNPTPGEAQDTQLDDDPQ